MIYLILFLGFLLRLINLNQSLWLDEAIGAIAVKNNSFVQLITQFSVGDFHPPLYYLVLKLWTNLFGYSEIALRFPSIIFGLLAIYFVYKIGGKKAALLLSINPLAVYYSQEARMYIMVMMFVTASAYFFLSKKRLLFIVFFLGALYSDYTVWLVVPIFFSIELLVSLLFLVPWLPFMFQQVISGISVSSSSWGDVLGRATFKNLALVPAKFIFGRISLPQWCYAVFSAIYAWLLIRSRNKFYWSWLLVPIILGFILSFKIPVFTYFRFLFVLPAFILLLADGVKNNKLVFSLICLICLISLIWFNINPRFQREDWRMATSYINSDPGKVEMPSFAQSAPLQYYRAIMNKKNNPIYLIRYVQDVFDPEDNLRKNLENSGYQKVEERGFNGVLVWKYENRN